MDTERNPRRSLAFGLPASSRVILLANSRRGSTDRNLGKMEPVRRRKPGFQTLQTNSPAVSRVQKNPSYAIISDKVCLPDRFLSQKRGVGLELIDRELEVRLVDGVFHWEGTTSHGRFLRSRDSDSNTRSIIIDMQVPSRRSEW